MLHIDKKSKTMPEKIKTDLDNHESVICQSCHSNKWNLKVLEKIREKELLIRIVCANCGKDLPEHEKIYYHVFEGSTYYKDDNGGWEE